DVYDLKQSDIARSDPTAPQYSIAIPGEEAKGVELDLTGQLLPGWNIKTTYTHADFKYLQPGRFDTAVAGQPQNRYSLYTAYERPVGLLKGAGAGIGVFGSSNSAASTYASVMNASGKAYVPYVPAGAQVNANLFYAIGPVHMELGVKNLLNSRLYDVAFTP